MPSVSELLDSSPLQLLAYWISERESIRRKKEKGKRPWTNDRILARYRFCNVHREDDRVTRWLKINWRDPHAYNKDLWHAMIVARFINWPDTLEWCGWPEPWDRYHDRFSERLYQRQQVGVKVFTGAYIVSTNGASGSKVDHVLRLFDRAWQHQELAPVPGDSLRSAHAKLLRINGIGSFMSAQIIADLKHTPVLEGARDWYDWAAPGPGSLRGLSRVRGYPRGSKWRKDAFIPELLILRKELKALTPVAKTLCLQDLQNCLCEFDKYMRVLKGEGRPRSDYVPYQSRFQIMRREPNALD